MRKILRWLGYEIPDHKVKKNKIINNADYVLCIVYAIISFINAVWGMDSLNLGQINSNGGFDITKDTLKTIFLMIINCIILIRMNIRLYIECKDKELSASKGLNEQQQQCTTIRIKALDHRIHFIFYCYLIDLLILLMNIIFIPNNIRSSLAILIFVPILVTLGNNFIDIAKNKYNAEEKISYVLSSMNGVNIDGN